MFSVVIPTRNRPALLQRALASVLAQTFPAAEVFVVVDGAGEPDLQRYRDLAASLATPALQWRHLPPRPLGHGPSFTRNLGAFEATGEYLCFLDDDDQWTDAGHLQRLHDTVQASGPIDLYMTAQAAVLPDGQAHPGGLWLSGLEKRCGPAVDRFGNHEVHVDQLSGSTGFSHLNCSAYRRAFFLALGGLDEQLRYEEDRDLFLRAIDAAQTLRYNPAVTALHHVPDRSAASTASTAVARFDRLLYQFRLFDKCMLNARHDVLRQRARTAKAYALRHAAELLDADGRRADAAAYLREAQALRPSLPGLAHALFRSVRAPRAPRHP
jgi:glycosyltransferase involved in cell wall biosynthesis